MFFVWCDTAYFCSLNYQIFEKKRKSQQNCIEMKTTRQLSFTPFRQQITWRFQAFVIIIPSKPPQLSYKLIHYDRCLT